MGLTSRDPTSNAKAENRARATTGPLALEFNGKRSLDPSAQCHGPRLKLGAIWQTELDFHAATSLATGARLCGQECRKAYNEADLDVTPFDSQAQTCAFACATVLSRLPWKLVSGVGALLLCGRFRFTYVQLVSSDLV